MKERQFLTSTPAFQPTGNKMRLVENIVYKTIWFSHNDSSEYVSYYRFVRRNFMFDISINTTLVSVSLSTDAILNYSWKFLVLLTYEYLGQRCGRDSVPKKQLSMAYLQYTQRGLLSAERIFSATYGSKVRNVAGGMVEIAHILKVRRSW